MTSSIQTTRTHHHPVFVHNQSGTNRLRKPIVALLLAILSAVTLSSATGQETSPLEPAQREPARVSPLQRIVKQLQHSDHSLRATSARALGHKGSAAISAIPKLVELLGDEHQHVRVAAAWSIQRISQAVIRDLPQMSLHDRQVFWQLLSDVTAGLDEENTPKAVRDSLMGALSRLTPPKLRVRKDEPQRPDPMPAKAPEVSPAQELLAQLTLATKEENRVDIGRHILALSQMPDGGIPQLLVALDGSEEFSSIGSLLCNTVLAKADLASADVKRWLLRAEDESDVEKKTHQLQKAVEFTQNLPQGNGSFAHEYSRLLKVSTDLEHRREIVRMLGEMGPTAEDAIERLIPFLGKENDKLLRLESLSALSQIAPANPQVTNALKELASDSQEEIVFRLDAWRSLVQSGESAAIIKDVLKQVNVAIEADRKEADMVSESSFARLLEIVELAAPEIRRGEAAEQANLIDQLTNLLNDDAASIRKSAANTLARLEWAPKTLQERVLKAIEKETDPGALTALCKLVKSLGPDVFIQLASGLNSFHDRVRSGTYRALMELGPHAERALPLLLRRASGAVDPHERAIAIRVIGAIGKPAKSVVPELMGWIRDGLQHPTVRTAAALSIGNIEPGQEVIGDLVKIAQDVGVPGELRAAIVRSMATCGDRFRDVLTDLLKDKSDEVAVSAAIELARHENWTDDALRLLLKNLNHEDWTVEIWSILGKIPDSSLIHLETIASQAEIPQGIRENAVVVLGQCGERAIPMLVRLLDQEELHELCSMQLASSISWAALPELVKKLEEPRLESQTEEQAEQHKERLRRAIRYMFEDGFGSGGPGGPAREMSPGAGAPPEIGTSPAALKLVRVYYGTNRSKIGRGSDFWLMLMTNFGPSVLALFVTSFIGVGLIVVRRSKSIGWFLSVGIVISLLLAIPALQRTQRLGQSVTARPGPVYGVANADRIEMGSCEVSIPAVHESGELEEPLLLKLEIRPDPAKHILVKSVTSQSRSAFYADLRKTMASEGNSILVFVHGYNVDFDDAARRTAQMAHDLRFAGAPVFFSWPSQANWHQYRVDERQVADSVKHVRKFLMDLAQFSNAESIHLVAHSMGTRALTAALSDISQHSSVDRPIFHQVVLAAPDINAEIFRKQIAPSIVQPAHRVTLYASSNDLALKASQTFNAGGTRAGDSRRPIVVAGIETIDVSNSDTSLLGHYYYGGNPTVLTDLRELLSTECPAALRPNLVPVIEGDNRYWQFQPQAVSSRVPWSTLWR